MGVLMKIKILVVSLLVMAFASGPAFALDRYKYSEVWQQPYDAMEDDGVIRYEQANDSQSDDSSTARKPSAVDENAAPVPVGADKLLRDTEEWKVYHEFRR